MWQGIHRNQEATSRRDIAPSFGIGEWLRVNGEAIDGTTPWFGLWRGADTDEQSCESSCLTYRNSARETHQSRRLCRRQNYRDRTNYEGGTWGADVELRKPRFIYGLRTNMEIREDS